MRKLIIHRTPQDFLDNNQQYLYQNELANNLTLGVPLGLEYKNIKNPKYRFITVTDENNKPEAVSINISPRLMISGNQNSDDAVNLIAEYFNNTEFPVTSIIGEKGIPEIFAKKYNRKISSRRDLIVHQLTKTKDLNLTHGKLVISTKEDVEILSKFRYEFDVDTFGYSRSDKKNIMEETESDIIKKNLFVWKVNNEIVSMAKIMRSTANIAIIGKVFTLKEFRGNGYGTSIVHGLSNEILNRGIPVCALFTDKLNLTSAKIYFNVGYIPVMEFTDNYFNN